MAPHETIFGRIVAGEARADIVYQDERAVAFRDIHPQAPVHVLVVPREALVGIGDATLEDGPLLGHLLWVAAEVARREGIAQSGYRLVINQGTHGQQSVFHLHVHLIGGRQMRWPPG